MKGYRFLAAALCAAALLVSCGAGAVAPAVHQVKIAGPVHGGITANPSSAAAGASIELTVTPETGYALICGSLRCAAENGASVPVSGSRFAMPDCDVTVSADFIAHYAVSLGAVLSTPGDAASTVSISDAYPVAGQTITLTCAAIRGNIYVADSLSLVAGDGSSPALTKIDEGSYNFTMPSAPVAVNASFDALYHVGDAGPGGGTVFYDRGSYLDTAVDSWRFMELSGWKPMSGEYYVNETVAAPEDIGAGKENTAALYAASGSNDGYVFGQCLGYRGGGLSDWYLPSRAELIQAASSCRIEDADWHFSSSVYLDGGSMHTLLMALRHDLTELSIDYAVPPAPGWGAYYRPARRF
jgi:hypothetical protein